MDSPGRLVRARDRARSGCKRAADPEALDVAVVGGKVPVASGRAEIRRIAIPGTAADDTPSAIYTPDPRRAVLRGALIIIVIAILDPLPNVAVHVIEPEPICPERADRGGLPVIPFTATVVAVRVVPADLVAPRVRRWRSATRRVFELALGEQPVRLTGHAREPCDVAPGIIPGDVDDWLPAPPQAGVAHARIAIAVRHAGVPVIERHVEPGDCKGLGEYDLVLRSFIAIATLLAGWRPHDELAVRNDDHLGAVLDAFLERVAGLQRTLGLPSEHVGTHLGQHVRADHCEPAPLLR